MNSNIKKEIKGKKPSNCLLTHSKLLLHIRSISGDDYCIYRLKVNGSLWMTKNGDIMFE